ncbi:MAG TPA: phosphate ABC transporter permease PstA [Thermoplasmata archaeon]|nr:phosphate ABC transporter permease PstA [Thermoplasmata archaeon]
MKFNRDARRRWLNWTVSVLCLLCVVVALIPLGSILYTAATLGGRSLSWHFLTAPQVNGGIGNAIEGTLILIGLGALVAGPVGVGVGIYLCEFGRGRVGRLVSFLTDVMTGFPSIVVGVFVYTVFTLFIPSVGFSAVSGAAALAIIMVPVVARTTEEGLRLVPNTIREAAYALGIPRYRTVLRVVLSAARGAVLTGALLSVMRAGGETAPLLLTAFGNPFGFAGLTQPVQALGPLIYFDGISPFPYQVNAAWGAALVLILMMLLISLGARVALRQRLGGRI